LKHHSHPTLSFFIGSGLSFIAALLCAMRGDKYVEEIHGVIRDDDNGSDPQDVSGENVKEILFIQNKEEEIV
jgi:hypothetical protein